MPRQIQQDVYNNQLAVPTGPAYGNDAYGLRVGGGTMSVHDLNHATASWGTSASQTLYDTNYSMVSVFHPMSRSIIRLLYHPIKPSIPNSSLGQGIINDAGCHFDQVLGPTSMNFSPHISGANANRGASSEWRFHNCWVSHEEQDEIHLTIALKRT